METPMPRGTHLPIGARAIAHARAAVVAAALLASASGATGEPLARHAPIAPRLLEWACGADHARYCHTVDLYDRPALRCLSDRHDRISHRCLRHLKLVATIEVCAPDYHRHCAGVPPGAGRGLSCLAGNRDRISARCDRALSEVAPRLFAERAPRRGYHDSDVEPRPEPPYAYEPPDLDDAPLK